MSHYALSSNEPSCQNPAIHNLGIQNLATQDLVRECFLKGTEEAWAEFLLRFNRLIAAVVYRTARRWGVTSREGLEDLMQEVYLKLCLERSHLLDRFEAQHPDAFYGYLKVITANLVQDHFKALYARKRGAGAVNLSIDRDMPEEESAAAELEILMGEIDATLSSSFSNEERVLFWLYYREGFTASALAKRPGTRLSVKGVESLLGRMIRVVRERLTGQVGSGEPAADVPRSSDIPRIRPVKVMRNASRSCGRRVN